MKEEKYISEYLKQLPAQEASSLEQTFVHLEHLGTPKAKTKHQAWEEISANIETNKPKGKTISFSPSTKKRLWLSIAAAAVLIIAIYQFIPKPEATIIESPAGNTLVQILPDESSVALNAETKIEYFESKWHRKREIQLTGEAFFNVKEGVPFIVNFPNGQVEVLGTSFNIYAREDKTVVSCATGIVRVTLDDQETVLIGGKEVTFTKSKNGMTNLNKMRMTDVWPNEVGRWQNGEHYFSSTKLSSVIASLERQFNTQITSQSDLSERFYSGYFSNNNLEEALKLVFVPMGLSYRIEGNKVIVE